MITMHARPRQTDRQMDGGTNIMAIARRMTIRSNLVSSYNVVVLLRSQVDMIRCKSVKDEVKRHIDKI